MQNNKDTVGAVWVKKNDKGVNYLSIKFEIDGVVHNIKGFLNGEKLDGDTRPDYILFKSKNIRKEGNK